MDSIPFIKMHGCGNDYIYVDCWEQPLPMAPEALAPLVSDRHCGIGADGLILLLPPSGPDHQATMRMFNADGSESEMCGNGLRCLAYLARRLGRVERDSFAVATGAGVLSVTLISHDQQRAEVGVDMGAPRLRPEQVPVRSDASGPRLPISLDLGKKGSYSALAVGMGNPHAVIFVDDVAAVPLAEVGPLLEHHALFPRRSNIEMVQVLSAEPSAEGTPPRLRQRTWERGSGITLACGTGACAVAVAAMLDQRISGDQAIVQLDGGDLLITWQGPGTNLSMQGEAVWICSGLWPHSAG